MNIRRVINYIGTMIFIEGIFMILPLIVSFIYKENSGMYFAVFSLALMALGYILQRVFKKDDKFYSAEGFTTVALGWIVLSIFGALPFYISREIPSYIDSVFETVSGFTTTGATILTDVTKLSKCMNFWRCFTHFVGGMGVLVLVLAIIPTQSENMLIMKAESPGPQVGKLVPRVNNTARTLYNLYVILTLIAIVTYRITGMPLYDSICIGMGTAGTGGFVVTSSGCADYNYVSQSFIAVFMLLFGVNFNLYYLISIRKIKYAIKSEEFRVYVFIVVFSIAIIFINCIMNIGYSSHLLHNVFFQVSSIMTTTGFAICDYTKWPIFSRNTLLVLMIIGSCAGSTAGGFKVSRLIIGVKAIFNEIYLQLHPTSVKIVKYEGKPVEPATIRSVFSYTLVYAIIVIVGIMLITLENFDFETTVSSVLETFNNIGLGLSKLSPSGNFSIFSYPSKIVFIVLMLAGRLEIFPMILLFSKNTWKRFI